MNQQQQQQPLKLVMSLVVLLHGMATSSFHAVQAQSFNCQTQDGKPTDGGSPPETCTADIELNSTLADIVDQLRDEYEDYPEVCRLGRDMCHDYETQSTRKGTLHWPPTTVGTRRAVLCPYAHTEPFYTYGDCTILSASNWTTVWTEPDMNLCPDPPFSRGVQSIAGYVNASQQAAVPAGEMCKNVSRSLENLMSIYLQYANDPVLDTDHSGLRDVCMTWTEGCLSTLSDDEQMKLHSLWNVSDLLFNSTFAAHWKPETYSTYTKYMVHLLPSDVDFSYIGRNVFAVSVTRGLTNGFSFSFETPAESEDGTFAAVRTTFPPDQLPLDVASFIIANGTLPGVALFPPLLPPSAATITPPPRPSPPLPPPPAPGSRASSVPARAVEKAITENNILSNATTTTGGNFHNDSVSKIPNVTQFTIIQGTPASTIQGDLPLDVWPNLDSMHLAGPIVYFRFEYGADGRTDGRSFPVGLDINVTFESPKYNTISATSKPICAFSSYEPEVDDDESELIWRAGECRLIEVQNTTVRCRCHKPGFYAVFVQSTMRGEFFPFYTINPPATSDLSAFLGFPYSRELYITGQVLRAVSLFCLLTTVFTFILLRDAKCRRSTPTRILVNLCLSLLVLLVVLYIAEERGGTRLGCRLSNVFRYYLVLVSLVWNGIEAHNMYRMLIKVFNSETSRFVLKASIVAWGAPALAVAFAFAGSVRAFDGTYYKCTFRCSLRDNTMYYGWLLPMSIIIAHNLIVFAMVVRVLCQKKPGGTAQNNKNQALRNYWTRLSGALTMLVLLGVPWIFSAFGVINAGTNESLKLLEGVFNVIFVVCINLQGLFIFFFHCVRNTSVRGEWKTALSTLSAFSSARTSSSSSSRILSARMSVAAAATIADVDRRNDKMTSRERSSSSSTSSDLSIATISSTLSPPGSPSQRSCDKVMCESDVV